MTPTHRPECHHEAPWHLVNCSTGDRVDAVEQLGLSWDLTTAHDVGVHLTCSETDGMANVLRMLAMPNMAAALIEGHAEASQGDEHCDHKGMS